MSRLKGMRSQFENLQQMYDKNADKDESQIDFLARMVGVKLKDVDKIEIFKSRVQSLSVVNEQDEQDKEFILNKLNVIERVLKNHYGISIDLTEGYGELTTTIDQLLTAAESDINKNMDNKRTLAVNYFDDMFYVEESSGDTYEPLIEDITEGHNYHLIEDDNVYIKKQSKRNIWELKQFNLPTLEEVMKIAPLLKVTDKDNEEVSITKKNILEFLIHLIQDDTYNKFIGTTVLMSDVAKVIGESEDNKVAVSTRFNRKIVETKVTPMLKTSLGKSVGYTEELEQHVVTKDKKVTWVFY